MGVYERLIKEEELSVLESRFKSTTDFKIALKKIREIISLDVTSPIEKKGFEVTTTMGHYDLDNPDSKVGVQEKSLYVKYSREVLIHFLELEVSDSELIKTFFAVNVEVLNKKEGKFVRNKFSIVKGVLAYNHELKEQDELSVTIPKYLEVDPTEDHEKVSTFAWKSPVPCFSIDGTGRCCEFRYNANPFNPLVKYKWCGQGCGNGCGKTPKPENFLDTCCQTHDCCYVNNKSYPRRCGCDEALVKCATASNDAGSDRVAVAFRAKMTFSC